MEAVSGGNARSPYRELGVNAFASHREPRPKDPGVGVSSGVNDPAVTRPRHIFADSWQTAKCQRCQKPRFVVETKTCRGIKHGQGR